MNCNLNNSAPDNFPKAQDCVYQFEKNISLLKKRFPQLVEQIDVLKLTKQAEHPENWGIELKKAKSGDWTASENGLLLHSAYNPKQECEKSLLSEDVQNAKVAIFWGFSLGYLPISFATKFPKKTIILIEPDINRLVSSFSLLDWTNVFLASSCVFLLNAPVDTAAKIIDKLDSQKCVHFHGNQSINHSKEYFRLLSKSLEQIQNTKDINTRTLEKFSKRWLRNTCRNLPYLLTCDGVNSLANTCNDFPICIIAAGPTLDEILPFISQIREHALIICVDTALRAVLRQNIQPDFIILADPQYWNARHLDGLSSKQSILITEAAAYPSVFRFDCLNILLSSSKLPLAHLVEKQTKNLGALGAGGSVTTTAWDFSRLLGTNQIFIAGLDLGFPNKKTHTKGSLFEEQAISNATRLDNAESKSVNALYAAYPYFSVDYNENPILTDKRMTLYAWWFEKNIENDSLQRQTRVLSPNGLKIKGISSCQISDLIQSSTQKSDLSLSNFRIFIKDKFKKKYTNNSEINKISASFIDIFCRKLENLKILTEKGISISSTVLKKLKNKPEEAIANKIFYNAQIDLKKIDEEISCADAADLVSLVFPTKEQLQKIEVSINQKYNNADENISSIENKRIAVIEKSIIVYSELLKSIDTHIFELKRSQNNVHI